MRCYNAAMKNRFQFSMARLFVLVTLVCVSAWAIAHVVASSLFSLRGTAAMTALGATIGFSLGLVTRKPTVGAILGAAIALVFLGTLWRMVLDRSP
jgi:hypothetical protein